ncbi:hypothetical protein B7494_g6330 [Chlorociboria aeruginascens]|nr:hypothetical protein B7494_g6330 [Chlorociboria aeruginascens]
MLDDKTLGIGTCDKSKGNKASGNPTAEGACDSSLNSEPHNNSIDHEAGDMPKSLTQDIARQIQGLSQEKLLDLCRQIFPQPLNCNDASEQAKVLKTIIQAVTPSIAITAIHGIDRTKWTQADIKALNYVFYIERLKSYPANLVAKICLQNRLDEERKIKNPTPEDLTNQMLLNEQLKEAQRQQDIQEGVCVPKLGRTMHNKYMNHGRFAGNVMSALSGSPIGGRMGKNSSAVKSISQIVGPHYTREEKDEIIRKHAELFRNREQDQDQARNNATPTAGIFLNTVSGPVGHPEVSKKFGGGPPQILPDTPTSKSTSQLSTNFSQNKDSKAQHFPPKQTSVSTTRQYKPSANIFPPNLRPPIQPSLTLRLSSAEHRNRAKALANASLEPYPRLMPVHQSQAEDSNRSRKRQRTTGYGEEYDSMQDRINDRFQQNFLGNSGGAHDLGEDVDDELDFLFSLELIREQEMHEAKEKKRNGEGGH